MGNGTVRPDPERIKAVKDWPLPTTQKELKSFVQFCSYCGRFIHHFSNCSAPLTDILKKNAPMKLAWSDQTIYAFKVLVCRSTSAPVLALPVSGLCAMMVWRMVYLSMDCGGHGATYGAQFRGEMALEGPKTATAENCSAALFCSCCALQGYVKLFVPSNKVQDTV